MAVQTYPAPSDPTAMLFVNDFEAMAADADVNARAVPLHGLG